MLFHKVEMCKKKARDMPLYMTIAFYSNFSTKKQNRIRNAMKH